MTRAMHMAFVFLVATAVVQANQCSGGSECPSDINPNNVASVLETKLQMGVLNDGGEDTPCSSGGEFPSDDSPKHVVSVLQTKLRMHMLEVGGEAAAAEVAHATQTLGKSTLQLGNLKEKPGAMLTELNKMVSRGEAPPFDFVSEIKNFALDAQSCLLPLREASAKDTTAFLHSVQTCNDQSKTAEGEEQKNVNDARLLHAACRDAEKAIHDHNLTHADSYCNKLGDFLHDATPLSVPDASTREASVRIVAAGNGSNWCASSTLSHLDVGCTAKEEELKDKKVECSAKQQSFEGFFCLWKYNLESKCKALDTCHSNAVTAYNDHVNETQALVEKWDVEFATLEKILCFCSVWLDEEDERDNRSQHNATQFKVCKTQTHTPVPMEYGTPAEKVTCLLTSVANHPGTSAFITQEYGSFTDFSAPVVPCVQAPTTEVPTTEAPTTEAPTTEAPSKAIQMLASGFYVNCVVLNNSQFKCWGYNWAGALGSGDTNHRGGGSGEMGDSLLPIDLGNGRFPTALAPGTNGGNCVVLDNSQLKCWGSNNHGQLGYGDTKNRGGGSGEMGDSLLPIDLGNGRFPTTLASGGDQNCVILDNSQLKCWGFNAYGMLGYGDTNNRGDGSGEMGDSLLPIDLGNGRFPTALALGHKHTCVVLDNSQLKCWGLNSYGQLGYGDRNTRGRGSGEMGDSLLPIDLGSGRLVTALASKAGQNCVVLDNSQLKCWGDNGGGQLGCGDKNNRGDESGEMGDSLLPIDLGNGRFPTALAVGGYHNCVVLDNSQLKCWGHNEVGQLGFGDKHARGDAGGEMGDALLPIDLGI